MKDHVKIRSFLHEWYEALYPIPSQFEKNYKMVQNDQKYDWPSLHDHKRNKTIHIGDFVTKIDSEERFQDLSKFLWIAGHLKPSLFNLEF